MGSSQNTRNYWIKVLDKIVRVPLEMSSGRRLTNNIPVVNENNWNRSLKDKYANLELVGRVLCGISPWLNTKQLDKAEESLRIEFAEMARKAIDSITDSLSPDKAYFYVSPEENNGNPYCQALVDAAFLAHAIIRGKEELYDKLEDRVKDNLKSCLKETRKIPPVHNNWVLFSCMIEAALFTIGEKPDISKVDEYLGMFENWYLGDGIYGDGPSFKFDYYNSFVIQPMLVDVYRVFKDYSPNSERYELVLQRAKRYAQILERQISPEGTYPVVGRSSVYRTGAFQLLAQASLQHFLPEVLSGSQVRCALTSVIHSCFDNPETFDKNGWLTIGVCGEQPDLGEYYICTSSTYLCTTVFLTLGLDENDSFWTGEDEPYTQQKIWSGKNMKADKGIN